MIPNKFRVDIFYEFVKYELRDGKESTFSKPASLRLQKRLKYEK